MDFKKKALFGLIISAAAIQSGSAREILEKLLVKANLFNDRNAKIYVQSLNEIQINGIIRAFDKNELLAAEGTVSITRGREKDETGPKEKV